MQRGVSSAAFLALVAAAAGFVWITGSQLPALVASHFGASGAVNAFMPRDYYVRFFLVFTILVPLVVVFVPRIAVGTPGARINIPNREYWLAPQRRAETVEFLQDQFTRFGLTLLVFLCYVHWLVLRANQNTPPNLPAGLFWGGLVAFLIATIAWMARMFTRFRLPPSA
jgi:hypothetical protein